jgi:hypothetical protein
MGAYIVGVTGQDRQGCIYRPLRRICEGGRSGSRGQQLDMKSSEGKGGFDPEALQGIWIARR